MPSPDCSNCLSSFLFFLKKIRRASAESGKLLQLKNKYNLIISLFPTIIALLNTINLKFFQYNLL